eukprot:gene8937-12052_t
MEHSVFSSFNLAIVSIFLFASVTLTSTYYMIKFFKIRQNKKKYNFAYDLGRYDEPKLFFFVVLTITSILDIPLYVACAAVGGPKNCAWDGVLYITTYSMHLIAVSGYAVCIIAPAILWSDIINQKDGKLWFTESPLDSTKIIFRILSIVYFISDFFNAISSAYNVIDEIIEPVLIFLICVGCFWCGIRLQKYVMKVQLGFEKEISFLVRLNITMLIIVISYLLRGVFVLGLALPQPYRRTLACKYGAWLLLTRWIPHIFCSFCLINLMRYSSAEILLNQMNGSKGNISAAVDNQVGYLDHRESDVPNDEIYTNNRMNSSNDSSTHSVFNFFHQTKQYYSQHLENRQSKVNDTTQPMPEMLSPMLGYNNGYERTTSADSNNISEFSFDGI